MRIVVTGLIATYPVGGVAWDYVQYVHGLAALGHEVTYLEDTGQWVYSPARQTFVAEYADNLAYLRRVLRREGGTYPFAFRDPAGALHGMDEAGLRRHCAEADLFLNVSGCCWLRDEYRGRGIAAYVDTDPCYSQAKLAAADAGTADEHVAYSAAMIRRHDVFFSFGESIGTQACAIPTAGLHWHPTRHPMVLADWPAPPAPAGGPFSTVMSWKIDVTPPVVGGRTYGGKDVEFPLIHDLPGRTAAPLEVAVAGAAPRDELRAAGWRVIDARDVSATPEAYQAYLAASRGELSVAKEAYVATRSGWFSTRSASYLATGRPVVAQDTGLGAHLPVGDAILTFRDRDGALAALEQAQDDHERRCQAAREIAATAFDAGGILRRLLADAGL
ncbi:MAG TPA: glycosyltransferase family 1 protein [Candidatus Binatia bacterium]